MLVIPGKCSSAQQPSCYFSRHSVVHKHYFQGVSENLFSVDLQMTDLCALLPWTCSACRPFFIQVHFPWVVHNLTLHKLKESTQ